MRLEPFVGPLRFAASSRVPTATAWMDAMIALALHAYRRFVSPLKGFRCAYHVAHGRGSCSDVALRIAQRRGGVRMLRVLPLQAARCRAAYAALQVEHSAETKRTDEQDGENAKAAGRCVALGGLSCCL